MAVSSDSVSTGFVTVCLGTDTECTIFRSRSALEVFKLEQFKLRPGVVLQAAAASDTAPLLPASVLRDLRAAVLKNSTEPVLMEGQTPERDAFWSDCQELQARLRAEGVNALVVPAGVTPANEKEKQVELRGKRPALHVRFRWSDPERWTLEKATSLSHWFGPGKGHCVGLGLFLFSDTVALDFDDLSDEAGLEVFERLLPHCADAPLEFTKKGAHAYFRTTAYSRSLVPFHKAPLFEKFDSLTARNAEGTPSFIAIAPSMRARTRVTRGRVPWQGRLFGRTLERNSVGGAQ